MGLLKGHIQDWLEMYGYDKGYDWDNLPDLLDMDENTPPAWENIEQILQKTKTRNNEKKQRFL